MPVSDSVCLVLLITFGQVCFYFPSQMRIKEVIFLRVSKECKLCCLKSRDGEFSRLYVFTINEPHSLSLYALELKDIFFFILRVSILSQM